MFPNGFFSSLGSIHVHVDGGVSVKLVQNCVEHLNREGYPSKVTSIQDAIAGPQRIDFPPTYKSHTPGTDQESLEYFSTTLFKNLSEASQQLRTLLGRLAKEEGIVIEAERIIAKIDRHGEWSEMNGSDDSAIQSADVGFQKANTLPIEIHFGCDIPKTGGSAQAPPLGLNTFLELCDRASIRVGGWFLFEDEEAWCYRSNMFESKVVAERVRTQRDDLAQLLNGVCHDSGFSCGVTALVEKSLGVWKTPLSTRRI